MCVWGGGGGGGERGSGRSDAYVLKEERRDNYIFFNILSI